MRDVTNLKNTNDWDYYPTYEAYLEMMYQFEEDYPDICKIISIGQSIEEREILMAVISDNISQDEGEAQFLYTSSMHGDETTGYVLSLRLIDYLLTNYGSLQKVDNMVNNLEIWINPLANPDGTYAGGNNTVYGATRYNANGIDLNRNYPDPEDGPHPDGNEWQKETVVFMEFAEEHHFVVSANMHGGTEVCNYPWDTWATLHPDDDWWQYVCHEYADTAQYYSPAGFMSGYDDGITNGYQWYSISGGRQDYMNYFHQCREFTLEISDTKLLPANLLPDWWDYNYRSLLNYMEQTLYGVTGTITDANTNEPLGGEVFILNHDTDSSWVYANETFGIYYRPLFEGTYSISFSAPGYYPQTIENVNVQNKQQVTLDIALIPGDLIVDFTASETLIPSGTSIDFTDLTFGNPISWEWVFEGGEPATSNLQNPAGILYEDIGNYDVSLTVSDGTNNQTITKDDYIEVNEEYIMQNTTVTTCTGVFFDSGGPGANYGNNQYSVMTFFPEDSEAKIVVEFSSFNVEYHESCDYDYLNIYDGVGTSTSFIIGTYCGTNSPGTITATNDDGALTFEFLSDGSVTESGWTASIACESATLAPIAEFVSDVTVLYEGESAQFTDMSLNDPESWEWTFEGGDPETSSVQNPTVTYNNPGVYDVTLTVENSAGSNSITQQDYITVNYLTISNTTESQEIQLYPVPANDILNIRSQTSILEINLISNIGRNILSVSPNAKNHSLNLIGLNEGFYIVEITTREHHFTKKIQIAN